MRHFIYRTRPTMAQSLAANTVDVNRLGTTHSALEPEANAERLDAYKALAVQTGDDYARRFGAGLHVIERMRGMRSAVSVLFEVNERAAHLQSLKPRSKRA